jgi:hypothetical protein
VSQSHGALTLISGVSVVRSTCLVAISHRFTDLQMVSRTKGFGFDFDRAMA